MSARGFDLPPQLDANTFDGEPVAERRLWISTVIACMVVRRGEGWREPVVNRARIIARDDAPTNSTRLIPFAAGFRW